MNFTLLKTSSEFAAVDYNEDKVRESQKAVAKGKDPLVELVYSRNFPVVDASVLTAPAKIYFMIDWCSSSSTKNRQVHFVVSCKGHTNTVDELLAAAIELLNQSGYANCPTLIYAHYDTDDLHIHVITTAVNENGKKVKDFRNATRFARQLATYQKEDLAMEAQAALKKALDYHFTSERQFAKILEMLGFKSGHREEEEISSTSEKKVEVKSVWSDNPVFLFLYKYQKMLAKIEMREIERKILENKNKIVNDSVREKRRKQLAAIIMKKRQEEAVNFYSGKKPLNKTELKLIQKVRAIDEQLEHRMAKRGIMRNDLYQMELFKQEMRKLFGVVVNYNYDKTGVPNGFFVIDPQSKSVWKGAELGFKFQKFLRPDEIQLNRIIEDGRYHEYVSARKKNPDSLVALEVRDSDGKPVYMFYGEQSLSLLPPGLGKSRVYEDTPRRILNASDMERLTGLGRKVSVVQSFFDAIPMENLYDEELQDKNVRLTYKKTLEDIGILQFPNIPEGFIKASKPYYSTSQKSFVIRVDSIGGRTPKYAERMLDNKDVAAYKEGEMLLEELVLKYYCEEVKEAMERYFHGACDDKGVDLECPAFPKVLSLTSINTLFSEMFETICNIADNLLDNGIQPTGSGISTGTGRPWGKPKKKRRGDREDTSSGMSW